MPHGTNSILAFVVWENANEDGSWWQDGGPTVFSPFADDTDYFGRAEQAWMINFRVQDLDAMVIQLREANIEVAVDPEDYPNGRFARLSDPEGNPIQLWQSGVQMQHDQRKVDALS